MKKLKVISVALFSSVLIAAGASPASASSGWDYVGASDFSYRDVDLHEWFTKYHLSAGGDFMVCVTRTPEAHDYSLWEYDASASKRVATRTTSHGCLTFKNIGKLVDGDNHRAEFMISTTNPEGTATVAFYD
ncbi:hypothetical protein ACFVJH_26685 [Streptomyces decoyicus]|uniref:hypothetical protein n=1 Tax=Streptomyces decoyicus TaxID=249567 RepID=UPI00362EF692